MRERLRVFIAACFYYSGLVRLAHRYRRRSDRRLIILNYHRATGGNLRRQLRYLRRHDRILELHVPVTIFLIPGYIEDGDCFRWLAGEHHVSHAQVKEITLEGCTYCLEHLEERELLARIIDARLSHATSVAEREEFLVGVREALAVPPSLIAEGRLLMWAEVREMEESGWVSFGAHTMHHPILAYLADPAEVRREVEECRTVLEQKLGHPVRTFAYPVGKPEHIGDEGLRAVKEAGYTWAVTTIEEANTAQTDPHLLRRLPGDVDLHWLVMASELVGLLGVISRLKKIYQRFSRPAF